MTGQLAEFITYVFGPYYGPIAGFVLAVLFLLALFLSFRRLTGESDS